MNIEIAGIQGEFPAGDIIGNLEKIKRLVSRCATLYPNVQLIVLPELAVSGYHLTVELKEASRHASYIEQELARVAKEFQLYLVYGYVEEADNRLYNSVKVLDKEGKSAANYRKIHLTQAEREFFSAGDEIVAIETPFGKIGLMICWDLAFPELARELAIQGVDIIVAPSAWEIPYDQSFNHFSVARAIDNTVFLLTVNHTGSFETLSFFGESSIFGPDGDRLVIAGDKEMIFRAELDMNRRKQLKETFFTMLSERRTDIY